MSRLYLVKNGVPYETAMGMDDDWAAAHAVVFGELDGGVFCTSTLSWKPQS